MIQHQQTFGAGSKGDAMMQICHPIGPQILLADFLIGPDRKRPDSRENIVIDFYYKLTR